MSKVFVVGTVGVPACYGGFESLVENLVDNTNIKYTVFCSSKNYEQKLVSYKEAELIYLPFSANGAQSIFYDITSLIICIFKKADNILLLGVSGAIALPLVKFFAPNCKVITNIDGLEWKREKWGYWVKKFLKFSEKVAVRYSDKVVSDNGAITSYVSSEYGKNSNTIAYGGDHAVTGNINSEKQDYCLALCRIEPENNVEMILSAFSKTSKNLKFVGNWNNSEFGLTMKEKFYHYPNLELLDPTYDNDTLFELRSKCDLYVHGHSAGGTNPSLVETMFFGIHVLCFDCSYNRESTENKAEYFASVEQLVEIINSAPSGNGIEMVEIAQRRYTWEVVRKQYEELFVE